MPRVAAPESGTHTGMRTQLPTTDEDVTAGRRVTPASLGAWLLKGNADRADLPGRFAADPRITSWCVQPSYRTRLMRAGQPVLFWASGSRHRGAGYGLWGLGRLTGPAERDPADGRWRVPLDLVVVDPAGRVGRDELRGDPELADLEVLRQPQAANPSFVTVRQFEVIRRYLDPSPSGPDGTSSRVEGDDAGTIGR